MSWTKATLRAFLRVALFGGGALAAFAATPAPAAAAVQVLGVTVFASGAAVSGTAPDSVTIGGGSVWIECGNGVDSTGVVPGDSTIVRYSLAGAVQHVYAIEVDGLKYNPTTGMVCALQNQDANATLALINPGTGVVTGLSSTPRRLTPMGRTAVQAPTMAAATTTSPS
jgi:hypothetical protein